ncbi:hypothetical protein [Fictibacillus sp. KU28468]|uniref:hypothetical protein n=1 Tax=Fictibacillus sp. KU28468 TaxID=2991053 RepID=UPI00223E0842|nr:hypothetical protein [Fictibacillus sp. KU28468]UZJ79440.1 hypothetical protein OKX00_02835 [Fictibacillus sp. KU28468]
MFSTREIATLIWISIFAIYALRGFKKNKQLGTVSNIFRTAGELIKHPLMVITIIYIFLIFLLLNHFKIITGLGLIKDYWKVILFGLFPMIATVATDYEKINVPKMFLGLLKLSIIPLFIIGEYTFNIFIELVLVPVITAMAIMITYIDYHSEYNAAKKWLGWLMAGIGVWILAYAFKTFVANINDLKQLVFWEKMFLELFLFLHLPLLIFLKATRYYEEIWARLYIFSGFELNKKQKYMSLWIIFKHCFLNTRKLAAVQKSVIKQRVNSIEKLKKVV